MLLSCGDALIDFVPVKAGDGRDAYVPAVGGSCLNIAVAMARLGAPTGFVGGISRDLFGTMIADHLSGSKVDLRYSDRSDLETTLAFVRLVNGEAHYAFYDETTAARLWSFQPGTIPFAAIDAVHVGSTTLINEPSSSAYLALVDAAKGLATISFDPNCRPTLVRDKAGYVARMAEFAARADIVRMSDVDFDYLFGGDDYEPKAKAYLDGGAKLVIVTRGGKGVVAWHAKAGRIEVAAPKVDVVDTIGAGDTFQGSMLVALKEAGRIDADELAGLTADELTQALTFGVTCAAVTCSRAGANPPWRHEVPA
ncbi:carbohydrate kinase family protein [Chthonobacter albigriseus]|uniref:carbohydrate kinase family protein n=1 Tax=Chthonobacter albigriseus TaxID=1683161 RepID=UPI0015EF1D49|nr:carbohydrate kinase [Chthonobacter albigriseus]